MSKLSESFEIEYSILELETKQKLNYFDIFCRKYNDKSLFYI